MGVLEHRDVELSEQVILGFNPWKGFGGFGTTSNSRKIHGERGVSIPGRDLGVLER